MDLRSDLVGDLSRVTFLDSTGLSVLVSTQPGEGGRGNFLIFGSTPQIRRLFEITGLTTVLTTIPL